MYPKFSIGFLWDFPTNSLRLNATIIPSCLKIWTQLLDEDEYDMKNYVEPIGWFFLSQIHPWGISFWLLGGNKVCEILRIVPLPSVECKLSFSRAHARLLRPKVDKVSQNRCFFVVVVVVFLWKSTSRLRLLILCNASRSEGTSLWVNVWTNEWINSNKMSKSKNRWPFAEIFLYLSNKFHFIAIAL